MTMTGLKHLAQIPGVLWGDSFDAEDSAPLSSDSKRWTYSELAGRLVELSGSGAIATLSFAFQIVWDAQRQGESVVWITDEGWSFFPPDAAQNGVDLDALVVVRVPTAEEMARAADHLVRSGAVGLLVMDLPEATKTSQRGAPLVPPPLQSRLAGLARQYRTAVLCLTEKLSDAPTLGPLVSLRCEARRLEIEDAGRAKCELLSLKDRRTRAGWRCVEFWRGPDGLR